MRPTENNIGSPEEWEDASDEVQEEDNESREVGGNDERSRFETPTLKRKQCKNNYDLDTALINALQNSERDEHMNFALAIVPSSKARMKN